MIPSSPHIVLTAPLFRQFIGRDFLVDTRPTPVKIRLDEVEDLKGGMPGGRAPFILVFSTPQDTLLIEGHYLMRPGEDAEAVQIHLIPTQTPPGPRRKYHAVFN